MISLSRSLPRGLVTVAMLLVEATAFASERSALDDAGHYTAHSSGLFWSMTGVLTLLYLLLVAFIFAALLRRRVTAGTTDAPQLVTEEGEERHMRIAVAISTALTLVVLVSFLAASLAVGREIDSLSQGKPDLVVKVTGRQWWWEVEYQHDDPSRIVTTANEIHLPVDATVQLRLVANDVIHSFWVPNLSGKMDLIPGRDNNLWIRAGRPGEYLGQCAEFCGLQHAHMRFLVVAEPREAFEAWLEAQRRPAVAASGEVERAGQQVFLSGPCVMCHTVRGTGAASRNGPDLTHVASRRLLASSSIPNAREHLERFVRDAQSVKPGTQMPQMTMAAAELDALVRWLETLR